MTLLDTARRQADTGHHPQPGWNHDAPCRTDPDAYWPTHGGNNTGHRAATLCAPCPRKLDCLTDAIHTTRAGHHPGHRAGHLPRDIRAAADTTTTTRNRRAATRARAARAAATGASITDLANAHNVTARTITRWITEHRAETAA